jgi:hypothetical protein
MAFKNLLAKNTPTFSGQSFPKAPHSIANERSFSPTLFRSEHIKNVKSYGRNGDWFSNNYFFDVSGFNLTLKRLISN